MSAGPLSAATTATQAVASSANSSAGLQLVSGDIAALGRRGPGALPRTPPIQREQLEEFGGHERPGDQNDESRVDPSRASSPRDQPPRAEDLTTVTGTPPPRGFGSGHSSLAAPRSERPSRSQSSEAVPDQAQQRLEALRREEQRLNDISMNGKMKSVLPTNECCLSTLPLPTSTEPLMMPR